MIVLRCSSCENEVEITEPLSNQTIACPKCGQLLAKGSGIKTGGPKYDLDALGETMQLVPKKSTTDTDTNEFPFLTPPRDKNELGWLNRYRVIKLLGQGGMAMVFLADDTTLQRQVALKVMKPEPSQSSFAAKRFLREARVMASLKDDHIVTIFDVSQEGTHPYLAMELLRGETLETWVKKNHPAPSEVLDMGLQIARGLAAAHDKGLIHRDVKPGNIWVEEPGGRIKLLDFGLARPAQDTGNLTCTGAVVGTPAYMAPEQADGLLVNERSDLFSLGCVLYEISTGKQAFMGSSTVGVLKAVALNDPTPLRELNPSMPVALNDLVKQLIAKNPEDRPASAAFVVAALEAISRGEKPASKVSIPSPSVKSGTSAGARGFKPAWILAAVAFVVAGILLGFAFGPLNSLFNKGPDMAKGPDGSKPEDPAKGTDHVKPEAKTPSATAQGVTATEVVLGLSASFSGTNKELGREMEVGIKTYFEHINEQGGVAGRKLRVVPLDDGYDPDRALANMRTLFDKEKAFGVIGNVGTPTAMKTLPYAIEKHMLFFGAFTGAPVLRKNPPDRFVFNVRASYEEETAAIFQYLVLVKKVRPEQIAVFAQADGYGDAGVSGVKKMLRTHMGDESKLLRVGYERNTVNVDDAVQKIAQAPDVRAVIMVATYRPAAAFIRKVKDAGKDPIFTNVSFVGSDPLAEELSQMGSKYGEGVIVTQVVPHPGSEASPIAKFRGLLARYHPNEKPSFVSLEGYLDAMVLVEGMKKAGDNLTTDSLIEALESMQRFDPGIGSVLNYGPSEHQASHKVWGTVLDKDGKYQVLELD